MVGISNKLTVLLSLGWGSCFVVLTGFLSSSDALASGHVAALLTNTKTLTPAAAAAAAFIPDLRYLWVAVSGCLSVCVRRRRAVR